MVFLRNYRRFADRFGRACSFANLKPFIYFFSDPSGEIFFPNDYCNMFGKALNHQLATLQMAPRPMCGGACVT